MKVELKKEPSFKKNGFQGFTYPLNSTDVEISYIDCFHQHDKYCIYQGVFIYYVVEGNGKFKIGNDIFDVKNGDMIEVPANTEFVYKGKMKLLLIKKGKFDPTLNQDTKDNDL